MRLILAILMSLALQSGALALGGGGGGGDDRRSSGSGGGNRFLLIFNRSEADGDAEPEEEIEDDSDPRAFTLPALVVPLSVDGRLTGFAYVSMRLRAADGQNVWTMQENAHYALDALVRASYRTPVGDERGQALNRERALDVWRGVLQDLYGANAIDRLEIRSADTRLFDR